MRKILIAPDSFKGSLRALEVADAIADGWRKVRPDDLIDVLPQADGGEGTLDAILAASPAARRHNAGPVTGPDGRPTPGEWLTLADGSAVVELAQCSGLPLMAALDPMGATSRGLGEVIRDALASQPRKLIVGLGGSASTDGGAGALSAMGLAILDRYGNEVPPGGGGLSRAASVHRRGLLPTPPDGVLLLSDVTAPLLGSDGAAARFGPQKGATVSQVEELEHGLRRFAMFLGGDTDAPGAGAAGGVGYGLAAAWGAVSTSGADYMASLLGVDKLLAEADVLLTGEGRFDSQSLAGKVVGQLLRRAEAHNVAVGIIAGQVTAATAQWSTSLVELAGSSSAAMSDTPRWLRDAGMLAAMEL